MARQGRRDTRVETFTHGQAKRWNIPTAELQALVHEDEAAPKKAYYPRKYNPDEQPEMYARNPDLDPQLVWRGKDEQDRHPLTVDTVPIYVQEKIHPKAIIDDLRRVAQEGVEPPIRDLFADFNGLPDTEAKYEFYAHAANWSNRMILGDSLLVMNSLAEKEGLRGQVQMIYIDPPYGIKFGSNWQPSTRSTDVKNGKKLFETQEPEVVRAFRDTWHDGRNTYLAYLRDRFVLCRQLLSESGSLFVQIGEENLHLVRIVLEEIFQPENHVVTIIAKKKSATTPTDPVNDYIVWFARDRSVLKTRPLYVDRRDPEDDSKFSCLIMPDDRIVKTKDLSDDEIDASVSLGGRWARLNYPIVSQHPSETRSSYYTFRGKPKKCGDNKQWRYGLEDGMPRLEAANRLLTGAGNLSAA
jgi:adenine-specific DNA-methyltransferase